MARAGRNVLSQLRPATPPRPWAGSSSSRKKTATPFSLQSPVLDTQPSQPSTFVSLHLRSPPHTRERVGNLAIHRDSLGDRRTAHTHAYAHTTAVSYQCAKLGSAGLLSTTHHPRLGHAPFFRPVPRDRLPCHHLTPPCPRTTDRQPRPPDRHQNAANTTSDAGVVDRHQRPGRLQDGLPAAGLRAAPTSCGWRCRTQPA